MTSPRKHSEFHESESGPSKGEELLLGVERMAHGGVGIAHAEDGRVVFVPGAFPGDKVRVVARKVKKSFIDSQLVDIVEAGPLRVASSCPAAARGAGCCDFHELDPSKESDIKVEVLIDQLRRVAKLDDSELAVLDVVAQELSPQRGWRTRVRLGVDKHGRAGLRKKSSTELVTDVACTQLVLGLVEGIVGADARRFTPGAEVIAVIDSAGNRHVVESRRAPRGRRAETVLDVVEGSGDVVQAAYGHEFHFPATAFWQAHTSAPDSYTQLVRDWLTDSSADPAMPAVAWDLYGGVGLFVPALHDALADTASLGRPQAQAPKIYSVDYSPAAAAHTQESLAAYDVSFRNAKVEACAAQLPAPGYVVLDPPRTGAGDEVVLAVAQAGPRSVVHVGCDPATFARDLKAWKEAGYALKRLTMVNAFPGTHHFETMALLQPAS